MANVFQKIASDRVVVLNVKEALTFDLGNVDYEVIDFGAYLSWTTLSEDNGSLSAISSQNIGSTDETQQFYCGLMQTYDEIPDRDNNFYCGYYSDRMELGSSQIYLPSNTDFSKPRFGTLLNGNVTISDEPQNARFQVLQDNTNGVTAYSSLIKYRFTVNNKGLSNQSITIGSTDGNVYDNSIPDFSTLLGAVPTDVAVGTFDWNNGVIANNLPTAFILRSPFSNIRLRVHSFMVEKIS